MPAVPPRDEIPNSRQSEGRRLYPAKDRRRPARKEAVMAFQVNGGGSPVKIVLGRRLARRLKGITPDFRALLAHEMVAGEVVLRDLTQAQASALVQVSLPYVSTVSRASPEQREDVKRRRLSISALYNKRREPTDAKLDRLIARFGVDRVMAALDRATKPHAVMNSAEFVNEAAE
jgi:hypothetical protein